MIKKSKLGIIVFIAIFIFLVFASCDSGSDIEYWNITWHLNDGQWLGGTLPAKVEKGGVLAKPTPNPTKAGYYFGGWYINSNLTTIYDFSEAVINDLNLYARWTDTIQDNYLLVTTGANSGTGSLRQAITNAFAGDTITIADDVKNIYLDSRITINKSINIEGNGVTIAPSANLTPSSLSNLLYINGTIPIVKINNIHFKNARTTSYGGAVNIDAGIVTISSCIFSDNQSDNGSAIMNGGILTINGCTFYNNTAGSSAGAIYSSGNTSTVNITGNLFYGNKGNSYPVIRNVLGTITSEGYNIVDIPLGTSSSQAGWTANANDKFINTLPFSTKNFKLFSDSGVLGVITNRPEGYPIIDFYGNEIPQTNAAAGAVQSIVSGSGWNFSWSANNSSAGEINITGGSPDEDGLYSGSVTLTASENSGYTFSHWLVNGEEETDNPINLTIDSHIIVKAVYIRNVYVISNTNSGTGSFREALTNAQDEDVIIFNLTAPNNVIQLTSALPNITKSITIEGNGIILTRSASWITIDSTTQLLRVNSNVDVKISRMWFKDGRATNYGAAIRTSGRVVLESCIFNNNQTNSVNAYGAAIYNEGALDIKGSTFFDNYCAYRAGAIYNNGTVKLTGNIFSYNGANNGYNTVYSLSSTITSGGYNVVDNSLGTESNQSGWSSAAGDKSITDLPISNVSFKLLSNSEASGVITTLPDDYPSKDFYGNDIENGAAAGAVQSSVGGSGYCIILRQNYKDRGTLQIDGSPDADGLYTGQVTLNVINIPGYELSYLVINDSIEYNNTINLTMDNHKDIYVIFGKVINVLSSADTAGTESNPTLRYALTNAVTDDIIRIYLTGDKTISLTSTLPQITKRIKIEGNGAILTRSFMSGYSSQILRISSSANDVIINRVHFKDGRATNNGGAIDNSGSLLLSNCIFSGNQTNGIMPYGGAIYNSGTLIVAGCTFYNNSANGTYGYGGAIYNYSSAQLFLVANIFNQNSADNRPVIYGTVDLSFGNITDIPLGTGNNQSGFSGDNLYISSAVIDTTTFTPVELIRDYIISLPQFYLDFLKYDFNGDIRTWPGAPGAVK